MPMMIGTGDHFACPTSEGPDQPGKGGADRAADEVHDDEHGVQAAAGGGIDGEDCDAVRGFPTWPRKRCDSDSRLPE